MISERRTMVHIDTFSGPSWPEVVLAFLCLGIVVLGIIAVVRARRNGQAERELPLTVVVVATLGVLSFLLGVLFSTYEVVRATMAYATATADEPNIRATLRNIAESLLPLFSGTLGAATATLSYLISLLFYRRGIRLFASGKIGYQNT